MTEPETGSGTGDLAAALGRVPSGLFIVTVVQGDRTTGMLGSWVQQCSFDPPLVSVAVHRDRAVGTWLTPGTPLAINILDEENGGALVRHFGKGFALDEPAFNGVSLLPDGDSAPLLAGALGYLDCRVESRHPAGDHELILARVVAGRMLHEGRPWVHVRRNGLRY